MRNVRLLPYMIADAWYAWRALYFSFANGARYRRNAGLADHIDINAFEVEIGRFLGGSQWSTVT